MPLIHPLLPTLEEAKANPEQIYSDHLPIFSEIPLQSGESIKIVSWNVYQPGNPWGFDPRGEEGFFYSPPEEESKLREERNIKAVLNFIDKHNVDVMTFQEAGSPDSFSAERLKPILEAKGWAVKTGVGSAITIYNANKYNEMELKEDMSVLRGANVNMNGFVKLGLVGKESENKADVPDVIINNIWIRHEDFPHETEALVANLLADDNKKYNCDSILVGDFNNRFAPANAQPGENITTGAIPPFFRVNGADFTDGIFYQQQQQKQCHQGEIEILNPATGEVYMRPGKNADTPEDMNRQRLILSCAVEHQNAGEIDPTLKKDLKDLKIYLSKTANAYGETGYAIYSLERHENWNQLKAILPKLSPQVEFKEISYTGGQNGIRDSTILIDKNHIKEVILALKIYAELGPAQRHLFANDASYSLTQLDEIKEDNAQKIIVAQEFKQAITAALNTYDSEMKKQGFLSTLFGTHGKTGLKRSADIRAKLDQAKDSVDYLNLLAEVLAEKKVSLKTEESLGSYIIKNLFENKAINSYLHLNEIEVKQYAKGRIDKRLADKKKINVDATLYDIDKKADRNKVNTFVYDRLTAQLDIENVARQEFKGN